MNTNIKVDDLSGITIEKTNIQDLLRREKEGNRFSKYNVDQVKKIVELVYLPHQVSSWNESCSGNREAVPFGTLNEERKPVSFEEVLPVALEEVTRLYGKYIGIPRDAYYISKLEQPGYDSCWISKKRFDGLVVREVEFGFHPLGHSSFDKMPDLQLFVPWERAGLLHPNTSSNFGIYTEQITEEQIKEFIDSQFDRFGKDASFGYFHVYSSRHICRKLGFEPETSETKGAKELFGFLIRFLNNQEKGKPFRE